MRGRRNTLAGGVTGSIVIAAGSGLAGLYAFENRVEMVLLGILLFFLGYRIFQFGVHEDGTPVDFVSALLRESSQWSTDYVRILVLLLGGVGIAVGVTMFARTIVGPVRPWRAVMAGVFSISGYAVAHYAMNRSAM